MKIIKRSGAEAVFDISKIITAIDKAAINVDLPEPAPIISPISVITCR